MTILKDRLIPIDPTLVKHLHDVYSRGDDWTTDELTDIGRYAGNFIDEASVEGWYAEHTYSVTERVPYMGETLPREVMLRILFPWANHIEQGRQVPNRPVEVYTNKPIYNTFYVSDFLERLAYHMELFRMQKQV